MQHLLVFVCLCSIQTIHSVLTCLCIIGEMGKSCCHLKEKEGCSETHV